MSFKMTFLDQCPGHWLQDGGARKHQFECWEAPTDYSRFHLPFINISSLVKLGKQTYNPLRLMWTRAFAPEGTTTYTGELLAEGECRSCSSRRGGGLLPTTLHGPLPFEIIFKLHIAEETHTLPKFSNEHIKFSSEVVRKCAHIHVKEQSESGQPSKLFLFVDLARSFSRCFLTAINRRWRRNVMWLFLEALRRTEIRRGYERGKAFKVYIRSMACWDFLAVGRFFEEETDESWENRVFSVPEIALMHQELFLSPTSFFL